MNKRQAKKIIKLYKFSKWQQWQDADRHMARRHRRFVKREILRRLNENFSSPLWQNISIEPSIGRDIGDVRRDLIDFMDKLKPTHNVSIKEAKDGNGFDIELIPCEV